MKPSKEFTETIRTYLTKRAADDEPFAARLNLPGKSVEECVNFILNTVKESGCNGFTDDEIYGIAVHYYDEDDIDPKYLKEMNCGVVVNHQVTLSEAEKAELAEKAKSDYYQECLRKQREAVNKPKKKAERKDVRQLSLFDYETED